MAEQQLSTCENIVYSLCALMFFAIPMALVGTHGCCAWQGAAAEKQNAVEAGVADWICDPATGELTFKYRSAVQPAK